jgi:hypothetical protein
MSRTFHHGERRVRVRAIRRKEPDLRKLAGALIDLAQAQLEADTERQHKRRKAAERGPSRRPSSRKDAA